MYLVPMNLAAQLQKGNARDLGLSGHYAGLGAYPTCFKEDFAILTGHRKSNILFLRAFR